MDGLSTPPRGERHPSTSGPPPQSSCRYSTSPHTLRTCTSKPHPESLAVLLRSTRLNPTDRPHASPVPESTLLPYHPWQHRPCERSRCQAGCPGRLP